MGLKPSEGQHGTMVTPDDMILRCPQIDVEATPQNTLETTFEIENPTNQDVSADVVITLGGQEVIDISVPVFAGSAREPSLAIDLEDYPTGELPLVIEVTNVTEFR